MLRSFKSHPLYIDDLEYILSTPGIDKFLGTTFLITGCTGLMGTVLVDALMRYNARGAGINIYAASRSSARVIERFPEHLSSPYFHILQYQPTLPFPIKLIADYVVPLASTTHPLAYAHQPISTIMSTVLGAKYALDVAYRCAGYLFFPSSVEIYGERESAVPFSEDDCGYLSLSTLRTCYPSAKRAGEALCQAYYNEYGMSVVIGRFCRVFGPTVLSDDSKASSQFLANAVRGEDIVLKSGGDQLFSYLYVADAVSALLYLLVHGKDSTAYNIASDTCNLRLRSFAEACAAAAGTAVRYEAPALDEKRGYSPVTHAVLSTKRLRALGWQAHYPFYTALRRTLNLMRG